MFPTVRRKHDVFNPWAKTNGYIAREVFPLLTTEQQGDLPPLSGALTRLYRRVARRSIGRGAKDQALIPLPCRLRAAKS